MADHKRNSGLRELINEKLSIRKNMSYKKIKMKPSSTMNHLDEIIDEYLDLDYFA